MFLFVTFEPLILQKIFLYQRRSTENFLFNGISVIIVFPSLNLIFFWALIQTMFIEGGQIHTPCSLSHPATKLSQIFTKLSAYVHIGQPSWLLLSVGMDVHCYFIGNIEKNQPTFLYPIERASTWKLVQRMFSVCWNRSQLYNCFL